MEVMGDRGKSNDIVWPFARQVVLGGLLCVLIACSSPPVTPSSTPTLPAISSPTPPPTPVPTEDALPTPAGSAKVAVPPAMEPAPPAPTPAPPQRVEHTVQPGETLLHLALQYQVPMAAIQLQNRLGSDTALQAGQVLEVPPAAEWEADSPFWVVTLVQDGATLSGIAALYGLDLATLRAVNDLANDNLLRVGQSLILPLEAPAEAVARAPDPTPIPVPPPTAVPAALDTVESVQAAMEAPESPPLTPAEPLPADVAAWPAEVFRLINAVRAGHGLAPYAYNETLAQAAQLHGQDCLQRGWCGHTGSDGSDVRTRILRAGYGASGWAECIVYSSSPQHAVDWWMDETPPNDAHRRTLLSTWVTEIGIAVVPTDWGYSYFIADFGRP